MPCPLSLSPAADLPGGLLLLGNFGKNDFPDPFPVLWIFFLALKQIPEKIGKIAQVAGEVQEKQHVLNSRISRRSSQTAQEGIHENLFASYLPKRRERHTKESFSRNQSAEYRREPRKI